ncbi:MAG: molybdopterin dinucleotide binding domain-containing protein [Caldilineaceae bacterium]
MANWLGVKTGDAVRVETEIGCFIDKAWLTEGIKPGIIAMSHHLGRWRLQEDRGCQPRRLEPVRCVTMVTATTNCTSSTAPPPGRAPTRHQPHLVGGCRRAPKPHPRRPPRPHPGARTAAKGGQRAQGETPAKITATCGLMRASR